YAEAARWLGRAADLVPDHPQILNNLGLALYKDHRLGAAIEVLERAVRLDDQFDWAHITLGNALLCLGRFDRGWPEYEHRRPSAGKLPHSEINLPVWDGSPLPGKRLLAVAEQGFGDSIWAARFLRRLSRVAGAVAVACQPSLVDYFQANGIAP